MYKIETVENQRKGILPMNDISATIFYNQRFIISAPIPEPLAWRLTKVEDISPSGVRRLTFAQDRWDQHNDYVEKDSDGNIIGMWADYYLNNVEPTPIIPDEDQQTSYSTTTSIITCTGKPQFKIGGSAKTFTVTYYNEDNEIIPYQIPSEWTFTIDDIPVDEELLTLTPDGNKVKVKFLGDDSYIGKILTITNTGIDEYFRTVTSEFQVEIIAL